MQTRIVSTPECQIQALDQMAEPLRKADVLWQLRHKLKRVLKRRLRYVRNGLSRTGGTRSAAAGTGRTSAGRGLLAGQWVRVKSREEIQATLDNWNYLKGCGFMEEMWQYCGTTQRVLKCVRRFIDERDDRLKKTRGMVFLVGLHCQGTVDYGRCDRNCYFFWREEWLEPID